MPASPDTHDAIHALLPRLEGWCTPDKASVLADLMVDHDVQCAVEIGVFGGGSLLPMALAAREKGSGTVWGIDPWSPSAALEGTQDPQNIEWWSSIGYSGIYRGFVGMVVELDLLDVCSWLRLRSEQAVQVFQDASVQLLHIDGNHSEVASARDAILWYPKLAPQSVVVVDDVDWVSTKLTVRYLTGVAANVADFGSYAVFTMA